MDRRTFLISAGASAGVIALVGTKGEKVAALPVNRPAGVALDPLTVTKYVDELPRPGVMPKTSILADGIDYYEIAVRQTTQTVLPSTMGLNTTVWGYGDAANPASNRMISDTILATSGVPTRIKWINGLVDAAGGYLPHLLPVDPTLHWANPAGPIDSTPVFTTTPGPYTGPVPVVTHVHGAHVGPESDGYAEAWYLPNANNIPAGYSTKGSKYDQYDRSNVTPGSAVYHYPNDQRAAFLWYHDHALGLTRLNVYAGPAGAYLVTGGTQDMPAGSLPSGAFDVPLVIQDRTFNADGSFYYPDTRTVFDGWTGPYIPATPVPPIWQPEYFANTMLVNGKAWPRLSAEPRRYRFRILNGCGSRAVRLKLVTTDPTGLGGTVTQAPEIPFTVVGTDQGFLPAPVTQGEIVATPAERFDCVVDLTAYAGQTIYLVNEGPDEPFGGGVAGVDQVIADSATTRQVMRIDVAAATTSADTTPIASTLTLPTRPVTPAVTNSRKVALAEQAYIDTASAWEGPVMTMLGTVDPVSLAAVHQPWAAPVTETPLLGAVEEWEICNFTVDAHPVHLHQVHFEILGRAPMDTVVDPTTTLTHGVCRIPAGGPVYSPPEAWELGTKDTVACLPQQITKVRAHFNLAGQYVWHCHIIEHEDNEMMRPMKIVANTAVNLGRLVENTLVVGGTVTPPAPVGPANRNNRPPKVVVRRPSISGSTIGGMVVLGTNVNPSLSGTNAIAAIRSNTGATITRSVTTKVNNGVVSEALTTLPAAITAASASATALVGTALPDIIAATNLAVAGTTVYSVRAIKLNGIAGVLTITGTGNPADQVVINVTNQIQLQAGAQVKLVNILPSQVLFNVTGNTGVILTGKPGTPAVPPRGRRAAVPAVPAVPSVLAGSVITSVGPIKASDSNIVGSVFAGGDLSYVNVNHQPV